ncbi:flagellar hook capping FlgD N-terminal domain-containing protein [Actibacterium sp. D379-3]
MDVAATGTTPATAPQTTDSSTGVINSDFETFLTMLTTQMKHQDPLNPMDSTDLSVQLATFSGVEQQVLSNELLADLGTQMGTSNMAQFATWVGMEARVAAPVAYRGDPITILPNPDTLADSAQLVVTDANGTEVQRLEIGTTAAPYVWTGLGDDGVPLADGVYSFAVDSYANGEFLNRSSAETYAPVTEVRLTNGITMLVLAGGTEVSTGAVTALRDPG